MMLYQVLLSIVGPVPVADGIGGLLLWIAGCVLTLVVPLYAVYYISRVMTSWVR